jgi:hypothetical protein
MKTVSIIQIIILILLGFLLFSDISKIKQKIKSYVKYSNTKNRKKGS